MSVFSFPFSRESGLVLQLQIGDGYAHVGEVVPVTQVILVGATTPAFVTAPRGPALLGIVFGGRLKVGHPYPARRLPVNAGGEHQPVLEPLMPLVLDAPPAQGVGSASVSAWWIMFSTKRFIRSVCRPISWNILRVSAGSGVDVLLSEIAVDPLMASRGVCR